MYLIRDELKHGRKSFTKGFDSYAIFSFTHGYWLVIQTLALALCLQVYQKAENEKCEKLTLTNQDNVYVAVRQFAIGQHGKFSCDRSVKSNQKKTRKETNIRTTIHIIHNQNVKCSYA